MHQPNLLVTNLQDFMIPDLEVNVFPNPISKFLIIKVIQQENELFFYEISDVTGRKMVLKEMQSNREDIDMSNYVSGIYLLRLFTPNTESTKVCKIIKK